MKENFLLLVWFCQNCILIPDMSRCESGACDHNHSRSRNNTNNVSGLDNLTRIAKAENDDLIQKERRKATMMALSARISIAIIVVCTSLTYYVFITSILYPAIYPDRFVSLSNWENLAQGGRDFGRFSIRIDREGIGGRDWRGECGDWNARNKYECDLGDASWRGSSRDTCIVHLDVGPLSSRAGLCSASLGEY